jgi:hypothetical protein
MADIGGQQNQPADPQNQPADPQDQPAAQQDHPGHAVAAAVASALLASGQPYPIPPANAVKRPNPFLGDPLNAGRLT